MTEFEDYQEKASKTIRADLTDKDIITEGALGLAGETGEVVDLVKKWRFQGHILDKEKVIYELGDVLWYITEICTSLNIPLSKVAEMNIKKLRIRYGDKFDSNKSVNRTDNM